VKRASWIGGASAASVALSAAPAVVGQSLRDVAFGALGPSAGSWPYMVATQLGLFKRAGLNMQEIRISSTAAGAQMLIASACDFVDLSVTQLIEAVQGGADLKMHSVTIATPPYALIAQPQIKQCKDLKGKSIVVGGINDATRIFAERIMQAGGVTTDAYQETYAGATTDRYAALRSGSVGAAILFPPWDFRATDDGYNVLGTVPGTMKPFPYVGLTTRGAYAQAHPDIILDMLKVYLRAIRWLYQPANKAHAVDILASGTNTASADAVRTYDEFVTKFKSYSPDMKLTNASVGVVIDMLVQLGLVKTPPPAPAIFFDDRYVTQAFKAVSQESA
jgi:ABC-type nitrate/sulfonate/bicarbonate transport system substrate-binding protein